jgi:hypothetical protein
MATPSTNVSPDPISAIVGAIKQIPRNARAGVLTGALLAIVAVSTVDDVKNVAPLEIILLGMIVAGILIATLKKDAIPSVALIFAFALAGILVDKWPPKTGDGPESIPVDSPAAQPQKFFGRVLDRSTRVGIQTVLVRAVNTGSLAVSDSFGEFDLEVPRVHFAGDSLQLKVQYLSLDTTFWHRVEGNRLRVMIQQPASRVNTVAGTTTFLGRRNERVPLMTMWPTRGEQSSPLTVILDSIRTVSDGDSDDNAHWSFDIELNGRKVLELPRRGYDARGRSGLLYLGREFTPPTGSRVVLRVSGVRRRFIDVDRVAGDSAINLASIAPNSPVPVDLRVATKRPGPTRADRGEFRFYFTILRTAATRGG